MLEFRKHDFSPLERFPLKWRWMLREENDFPPEVYSSIRPLRSDVAQRVWDGVESLVSADTLEVSSFESTSSFAGEEETGVVKTLSKIGAPQEEVVVLWSRFLGVKAPWSMFTFRWQAFCHSAPGNVLVTPVNESWLLLYQPFNRFHVGLGRRVDS